ncbi:hypothetical protein COSMO_75 [Mycobacterium phage Cosmo]|uniref:Uncharacterized protein n=1 Tax=Mycobacterium phage Cosmo TaxID=1567467 RepID=A0A0B4ZXR1_9CAUD|nr:hypothetical protein COSMO_75 [Mycobacterium phage Cosmo]
MSTTKTNGSLMNSFRTRLSGRTGLPILTIFSLLAGWIAVWAYRNRENLMIYLVSSRCRGCDFETIAEHRHANVLGRFLYVWRYNLWDRVFPDKRPVPTPDPGWWIEYENAWVNQFSREDTAHMGSWVRAKQGYWVWVTDTPQFDRDFFDAHGFKFPPKWITQAMRDFYYIGADDLSVIVNFEPGG